MKNPTSSRLAILFLVCSAVSSAFAAAKKPSLAEVENIYADLNDAYGIMSTIDSGLVTNYDGKNHDEWQKTYQEKRKLFLQLLPTVSTRGMSAIDARALDVMRKSVEAYSAAGDSLKPSARCGDASRRKLGYSALRESLYSCFDEIAGNLQFEGTTLNRVSAFELLSRIEEPDRRKALFLSFKPLWTAINGASQPDSPYRRLIRMAAADARKHGSAIDAAARTLGVPTAQVEAWLEQILDTWRQVSGDQPIEPWDMRFQAGEADRALAELIPRESLQPITDKFYKDLGADLKEMHVLCDLDARPGKAPLAYADFVTRGRMIGDTWRPTVVRISANNARGGLSILNELVHENGHAVHMMALRTRPAFMDLGDPVFYEAFADVTSWSTYEPAWQSKYLAKSASESASLRSLFSGVMMDVAWALFEARMLRHPEADPNVVWTEITSRYLHVVPHPELSWWAVRVQLVDAPGYMVNYGLGAVITADIRAHIRGNIGQFDAGNPQWYRWISEHLLRSGMEQETSVLLKEFLGRPVSPQALLKDLQRLSAR